MAEQISLCHKWLTHSLKIPDRDAIIHLRAGYKPFRWTFRTLFARSQKFIPVLLNHGIKRGDVCAMIIPHNKYVYPLYMALVSMGAVPAILPYPNIRLHPDKFRNSIRGMAEKSGLDWILTTRELEPTLVPLLHHKTTIKGICLPLEGDYHGGKGVLKNKVYLSPYPTALLQHSSGTTGLSKPVILSHHTVINHIIHYASALHLSKKDKIVSWLPLYHDMGLIAAFHLPLYFGIPTVIMDPFEWIIAPHIFHKAVSREKGTLSWLPNFSYNIMADKIKDSDLKGTSLSSLRMLVNCSEPVRAESHQRFFNRFAKYGFKKSCLSACYAMAETTFAVTQTEPKKEAQKISVDGRELSRGRVVIATDNNHARVCVSSGKLIKGCRIRIINQRGQRLGPNRVGEIVIQSDSLFDGYRNYPEKTAEVLKKGWYHSGDLGFCHNNNYYIVGRKKDVIIVAGHNIYPEDIEDALNTVKGVIPGRAIAFGEFDEEMGTEQISVAAETDLKEKKNLEHLRLEIMKACMHTHTSIKKVYLVPPRWLIKSSSGKLSRKDNKDRLKIFKKEILLEE
ncbi:MAG: AMP-binding protein [Deltaproteobacteria bacterium]|nr:AMP-binding protein [Deltaproteobacteria bacterium]